MELDPLVLARIQFAANISFHILFPTITIGLSWFLLFFRLRHTASGDEHWEQAYHFWVKVFALSFALGVVSGVSMSFQFGTNWPGFMERAGDVAGPLLGYEVLTAFFLEASFLGIMLFGKDRVSNTVHLVSAALVALGTTFSAFWILSLNAWMQTPAGFVLDGDVVRVDNWWAVIWNPSFPYRFAHMMIASILSTAFFVAGISAWRVRKKVDGPATWKVIRVCVVVAAVLSPVQLLVGDLHGLNSFKHQPAKIAAVEGVWETQRGAPLLLFAWPDEEERRNRYTVQIPKMASWFLTYDLDGEVPGLNEFEGAHPPVAPVFWSFRAMVGIGLMMIVLSWRWLVLLFRKGTGGPVMLTEISWMTFSGLLAVLAGWYVAEIGRQPWLVHGLVRTSEVVADHSGEAVLATLTAYLALYLFLLAAWVLTLRYMAGLSFDESGGPGAAAKTANAAEDKG